jgi:Cd2+/Zn2+-exporting ATPase
MGHKHDHSQGHNHTNNQSHNHGGCCDHGQAEITVNTKLVAPKAGESTTTFKVINMDCVDEIKAIQDALKNSDIVNIQANLMASTVRVVHKANISPDFLRNRIESTVVRVVVEGKDLVGEQNRIRILKVALSGIFFVTGMVLEEAELSQALVYNISYFISIMLGGTLVFPKAFSSLKRFALDMNVLMTMASIGAVIIGEVEEAAAVVFLFALSELLESLSVQRARNAISSLLKIAPQTAHILNSDGSVSEVKVEDIAVSQIIKVRAGENIPMDGVVVAGVSSVNQAALTGEALPVAKKTGDIVFAGTLNEDGSLEVEVSKVFSETKIARVIKLVEEAQAQRAPAQRFVDQFARIYTPMVFALAILTYLIPVLFFQGQHYEWFYKALVLLVIACPCALVISTPVSIVSGLTALARRGVLVKGGAYLEILGKIDALAVDKTGTLTSGKPEITKVISMNTMAENEIISLAAALETHSTHPIAMGILKYAKEQKIDFKKTSHFKNIPGLGLEAVIEGENYFLGNHRYIHDLGLCTTELEKLLTELESDSYSVVVLGHRSESSTGSVLGVIVLADKIRSEAKAALAHIKSNGVAKIILISGDNQKTTSKVGSLVGVDLAVGDLLPEEKVSYIEKLKKEYKVVAMLGDGVNDAPAMAKSNIGIAMGGVGSDTAIETADVALMTDDLSQLAGAIKSSKKVLGIIKFNISFAIITKVIFLILTFMGFSSLWLAIVADTGATLIVTMNSLRLLKSDA